MSRRSHKPEEDVQENIVFRLACTLPTRILEFLEVEAKRLSDAEGRKIKPQDVVRALIVAYYEKRMLNLVTTPDD
jgi:hypothetical protein